MKNLEYNYFWANERRFFQIKKVINEDYSDLKGGKCMMLAKAWMCWDTDTSLQSVDFFN